MYYLFLVNFDYKLRHNMWQTVRRQHFECRGECTISNEHQFCSFLFEYNHSLSNGLTSGPKFYAVPFSQIVYRLFALQIFIILRTSWVKLLEHFWFYFVSLDEFFFTFCIKFLLLISLVTMKYFFCQTTISASHERLLAYLVLFSSADSSIRRSTKMT